MIPLCYRVYWRTLDPWSSVTAINYILLRIINLLYHTIRMVKTLSFVQLFVKSRERNNKYAYGANIGGNKSRFFNARYFDER